MIQSFSRVSQCCLNIGNAAEYVVIIVKNSTFLQPERLSSYMRFLYLKFNNYGVFGLFLRRCFYCAGNKFICPCVNIHTLPSIKAKNLSPQTKRYINHVERLNKMIGIKDILKKFELTVPEEQVKDFDRLFRDNYKSAAEVSKIKTARDNCMAQLEQAQKTVAEYKENIAALNNQIEGLVGSIEKMQEVYGEKIARMELEYLLDLQILSAKARSLKAVKTLLDVKGKQKQQEAENEQDSTNP